MNPILIILRLIFPLVILRYPLAGGIIAILLDNIDWYTKNLLGIVPLGDYQLIDKMLDMYYLSLLAWVCLRFKNKLIKHLLLGLFIYRLIGFVLFEVTHIRALLLIFPNIFENFFFFYYILTFIAKYEPKIPYVLLVVFLVLITFPKLLHEYAIHILQDTLVINFFGYPFIFEGTYHQVLFIGTLAVAAGLYYRSKKPRKHVS